VGMTVTLHGRDNSEFKVRGYATTSTYNGLYPVVTIDTRDVQGAGTDSVTLFLNPEQLAQLRTGITAALRDYNKEKLE
jgi:hypothetical protein